MYMGSANCDFNKAIFDALLAERESIEQEFGEPLDWQRLDNRCACRIQKRWSDRGGLGDREAWNDLQELMIEAMTRFERAFKQRLLQIKV